MTQIDERMRHDFSSGTTDHGQGRVIFNLFAPNKRSVEIIGDFNDWSRGTDALRPNDQGLWSLERHFDPGRYLYQYVVDGDLVIADPYGHGVEWGRPPKSVLEVGKEPYRWRHRQWQRPAFAELVIHEVHLGDFTPGGGYLDAIEKLDYLKDLGVNAIQLLPVTQGAQKDYWGYQPAFFFAAEQRYGTAEELKRLIDEAHGRDITVILDIVLAHSSGDCQLCHLYSDDESPWYGTGVGGKNEFGFPTFDHRKPAAEAFARDIQTYWLREFRVDGLRYDYVKNIGYIPGKGADFLVDEARNVFPEVYLIGENLPEDPAKTNTVAFDGTWFSKTTRCVKPMVAERKVNDFDWNDFDKIMTFLEPLALGYRRVTELVNYLESHDEERLAFELNRARFNAETIAWKAGLAATVLLTMPGQPMIYMGGEWGEASPKRLDRNPIHWEQLDTPEGRGLHDHYRRLIRLRREHPALRSENHNVLLPYGEARTLAYHRWKDEDDIVVAFNFRDSEQTLTVCFPALGSWHEILRDRTIEAKGDVEFKMEGYSAAVFVRIE